MNKNFIAAKINLFCLSLQKIKIMIRKIFYLAIASFFSASSINAQTLERDFWVTFGQYYNYSSSSVDLQIRIVSGKNPTTGTIHFTNLGIPVPFSIGAYEVFTYPLDNSQKEAVYNTTTGKSNRTVHINSSDPIKVYALNQHTGGTDATNIFPIEVLDNNYYQISHQPYSGSYPDAYAVVAVHNNTQLFHNGAPAMALEAGEVYYRRSSTDMTGAHITANNPVAFFAVAAGVQIPHSGVCCVDPLMQQLAPVKTWGKDFFVPVSHLTKDRVRIVASQDNTTITQTGGVFIYSSSGSYTINAGEYIELEALLTNNGCYIHANNFVGVCTYLTSASYHGFWISDPAQAWLPATEQMGQSALIAPFVPTGSTNLNAHYAIIVTPFAAKEDTKVSIGGAPSVALSGGSWYDNAEMSFYIMPLTNETASYNFTNNAGLIVMGYGTGSAESYYYLAGSAMRDLDAAFYANDIHFQDLKDTAFCAGAVEFRAEIEGELHPDAGSLKWYVDGVEETSAQDQLEWNRYFAAGEYEITMKVHYETGETVSKTGTLQIAACNYSAAFYANDVYYADLADTLFCVKHITFTTTIEGVNAMTSLNWYIDNTLIPDLKGEQTWDHLFGADNYIIKMEITFNNGETQIYEGALSIGSIINIVPVTPDGGDTNINGGTPNTGGCFKVGTKIYFNAVPK